MKKEKGSKASNNRKKRRRLKLYLGAYLTALMTLAAPIPHALSPSPDQVEAVNRELASPKEYAYKIAYKQYGWGKEQHKCLGILWGKESAWNYEAKSPTQDYGIPQRHMRNNTQQQIDEFLQSPATQIEWGLNYINSRYGSPCQAWQFWQERNWY